MRIVSATALLLALTVTGCGHRTTGSVGEQSAVVEGRVALGPQCPVQQAEKPCPSSPPSGTAVILTPHSGSGHVLHATTRADGTFRISVSPGTYDVTADAGMRCDQRTMHIEPGARAKTVIRCDTGIR